MDYEVYVRYHQIAIDSGCVVLEKMSENEWMVLSSVLQQQIIENLKLQFSLVEV